MSHQNKEFGISSWAIENRVTVYIFTLLVTITGLIAYVTMPREDFPEIIENKVYISSVFPGNSTEDVEKLIIKPLEKELKNSRNYVSKFVPSSENNSNMCIEVKRTDIDATGRIFTTMDERCKCEIRISHLIMCRHEIILHKKFILP